jgi:uncharacterized protein (TIGR03067 family)
MHCLTVRLAMMLLMLVAGALTSSALGDDREAIQGTWQFVSGKNDGAAVDVRGRTIAITARTLTFFLDGAVDGPVPNYKLDAAAGPKEIDLTVEIGDKLYSSAGIYRLEDDTLTLCYASPGDIRPKKFETVAGDKCFLVSLKRGK